MRNFWPLNQKSNHYLSNLKILLQLNTERWIFLVLQKKYWRIRNGNFFMLRNKLNSSGQDFLFNFWKFLNKYRLVVILIITRKRHRHVLCYQSNRETRSLEELLEVQFCWQKEDFNKIVDCLELANNNLQFLITKKGGQRIIDPVPFSRSFKGQIKDHLRQCPLFFKTLLLLNLQRTPIYTHLVDRGAFYLLSVSKLSLPSQLTVPSVNCLGLFT